jgi:hypothetical protein
MSDDQAGAAAPVPYKCAHYPDSQTNCVRYNYDPATGRWDTPQFGVPVDCSTCEYWMSDAEVQDLIRRGLFRSAPQKR